MTLPIALLMAAISLAAVTATWLWLRTRHTVTAAKAELPLTERMLRLVEAAVASGPPEASVEAQMANPTTRWLNFPNGTILVSSKEGSTIRLEMSLPEYCRLEWRGVDRPVSYVLRIEGIKLRSMEHEMSAAHAERARALFVQLLPYID